ncbi:MAG TPA: leucyl aminopeptidase [Bacteroidia bacterium]|jgi:leucyl aminopeptidase|nr:leucyl aminopeptidase [Bacteroidia bacterium]
MMTAIKRTNAIAPGSTLILLARERTDFKKYGLSPAEIEKVKKGLASDRKQQIITSEGKTVYILQKTSKHNPAATAEVLRKTGSNLIASLNENKISSVTIADGDDHAEHLLAFAEGIALANYQFLKYKVKDKAKEENSLKEIHVQSKTVKEPVLEKLRIVIDATCRARDLVNEPVSTLGAVELSKAFQKMGKEAGFSVEVLNKSKIESLKMGGLLAVNKGSVEPPTFSIMHYKHPRAKNKKPILLVGKGVVFDTGGYNIKVGTGMETMKCDMAGGAAVGCVMYAIAKAKLHVNVIALVPATDNRIDGKAYVAGDVITMYNGLTVEVLNTDAEGRMILADALAYGEQFEPELVMEFSTLTGAAMAAVGQYGIVTMGTADERTKNKLKSSGNNVHERLAEFPFWEEYDELIKSDVAEIKNIGGPYGGAITAGKFLAHFVKSPYMHFDIAGPAFISAKDAYRSKGGTGVGVRLLFDFLSNY